MKTNPSKTLVQPIHRYSLQKFAGVLVGGVTLAGSALTLHATLIPVPNSSFELQSGAGQFQGISFAVDAWQRNAEPGYFAPYEAFLDWSQTSAVFVGTSPNSANPYTNLDGSQAGYILDFPQAGFFQDYATSPTHDFNATFQTGDAYSLTVGLFGKGLTPASQFRISLYYRDTANTTNDPLGERTIVSSTLVNYDPLVFVNGPTPSLVDYTASVPGVQATDLWAGQHIGIMLDEVAGAGSFAYWDFDNVRLVETAPVPEPASAALLALGVCALASRRRLA